VIFVSFNHTIAERMTIIRKFSCAMYVILTFASLVWNLKKTLVLHE